MNPAIVDLLGAHGTTFGLASLDLARFDLAGWAWAQVWQVTLVAVALGVLARWGCRRRPHLAYLLWMLVIVKALTPPLVASPVGVFSWALRSAAQQASVVRNTSYSTTRDSHAHLALPGPLESALTEVQPEVSKPVPATPTLLARVSLAQWALLAWAGGALVLGGYALLKWGAMRRKWQAAAVPAPAELTLHIARLAERLGLRRGARRRLRLLVSEAATAPAVFGVWRPTLLLPAGLLAQVSGGKGRADEAGALERATDIRRESILAHELIHVRRGDPAAAWVQLVAQLVWWFHPLVWLANREARRERERACDEEVVAGLGCRPADYARALLDVLAAQLRPQRVFAGPDVGMLGVTARRLEHIARRGARFQRRTPTWNYVLVLVALALVLPGAGLPLAAAPADKAGQQSPESAAAAVPEGKDKKSADKSQPAGDDAQPAGPTIVVTRHALLWDDTIVTWDEILKRFRAMRPAGPIQPQFLFTNGAIQDGRFDAIKKELYAVYKELLEPAGMSLGSISPRAGERLDKIRTADDLRPDANLTRAGRVLTPAGQPAAAAQVIVLPLKNDLNGVILRGKQLRDPFDHVWSATDAAGRYTIYPDEQHVLVALHASGWHIGPGPAKGEDRPLRLEPWANVALSSAGGDPKQQGTIRVHPPSEGPEGWDFTIYEIRVGAEPVTVPVPAGQVKVERSLKMADGGSSGLPGDKFDLRAGETRTVALKPANGADRAEAERTSDEVRALREQQQGADKPTADKPAADQAADGAGGTGKVTGTFTPIGGHTEAITDADSDEEQTAQRPEMLRPAEVPDLPALRQLQAFGAHVSAGKDQQGTIQISVNIVGNWQGGPDEIALLDQVPHLWLLQVDLKKVSAKALGALAPRDRLQALVIESLSDLSILEMATLPAARQLVLNNCSLGGEGSKRLVSLMKGVESLQLQGALDRRQPGATPQALPDAAFEHIGQLRELKLLLVSEAAVSDAGIAHLAGMEKLKQLTLVGCPSFHGTGLAKLAPLGALDNLVLVSLDIDSAGMQALSQLGQLRSLMLAPNDLRPADAGSLVKLDKLRSLTVSRSEFGLVVDDKLLLGNALLAAAGKLPQLRTLTISNIACDATGLADLATAARLQSLALDSLRITDQGLAQVGRLANVRRLILSGDGEITDQGLAGLAPLTSMVSLYLPGAGLTDAALRSLAGMKKLETLQLSNSKITGTGLSALASLESFKSLTLEHAAVDDRGCQALPSLAALKSLDLSATAITDAALPSIAKMPRLRFLNVHNTKVTADGLSGLAGMKSLRQLVVGGDELDQDQIAKLRQALPQVKVANGSESTWAYSLHTFTYSPDSSLDEDEAEQP